MAVAREQIIPDPPAEIRDMPNWVCWKFQQRQGDPKPTKVPVNPKTGGFAKSNDPATWTTFDEAVAASGRYDGIGIMFSDRLCGIDLDGVVNDDGRLNDIAKEAIDTVPTYAEYSPSGTGLHLLCFADRPGKDCRRGPVEIYFAPRYFTFTGRRIDATPNQVRECSDAVKQFHGKHVARPEPKEKPAPTTTPLNMSDSELLDKARQSKNGREFSALFDDGSTDAHGNDDSAADMALCSHLAFWTGNDAGRMKQLFRASALGQRPKADRDDYVDRTIERAIEGTTDVYKGPESSATASGNGKHHTDDTPADDAPEPVEREPLDTRLCVTTDPPPRDFLFDGRVLPIGTLGALVAQGGLGKSYLALSLAMSVSTGRALFPSFKPTKARRVLLINGEDAVEEVHERMRAISNWYKFNDEQVNMLSDNLRVYAGPAAAFKLCALQHKTVIPTTDYTWFCDELTGFAPGFAVIDPQVSFYGAEENDNSQMQAFVTLLRKAVALVETGCSLLTVHHVSKSREQDSNTAAARGAGALRDAMRSAWTMTELDPKEMSDFGLSNPAQFVKLTHAKSTSGPKWPRPS